MRRWLKRFALALLALVTLALGFGLIAIHTDWGRERVRRIAEAELRAKFPGGARIGKLEGSLLGDFTIRDLELADVHGAKWLRVGSARGNVALGALLGKTLELEALVAEDVELYATRQPFTADRDAKPLPWKIELPDVTVHRARIVLETAEPVTLDAVELTAALTMSMADGSLRAHSQLRGRWRERDVPVDATLRLGARAHADALELPLVSAVIGGVHLVGAGIILDGDRATGYLTANASPAAVTALVPELVLPAHATVAVLASHAGSETQLEVFGTLGGAVLRGQLLGTLATRSVRGLVSALGVDLGAFTPELPGRGDVVVAVVADPTRARGTAAVRATVLDLPAVHALVGFDTTRTGGPGFVLAGGGGHGAVAATGELRRAGDRLELVNGHVVATARDAAAASAGRVPLTGSLRVDASVHGPLIPDLALAARGTIAGSRLRSGALRIGTLRGELDVAASVAALTGRAHVRAGGIRHAGTPLGDVVIDAHSQPDGTIAAHVQGTAAAAPITLEVDAEITLPEAGGATQIALGEHRARTPRATWRGRGGQIAVTAARVTFEDVRSASGEARLELAGSYAFPTRSAALQAALTKLPLTMIDPAYRGTASARVALRRRGLRWDGTASLTGAGLVLEPQGPAIDGDVELTVTGRRVALEARATTARVGGARLVLDVDGPRDLTDVAGWRRLERAAVRRAVLGLTRIDLAAAGVSTGGIVDGELQVEGAQTTGALSLRALRSPLGVVEGEVTFAPMDHGELGASSSLHVAGLGDLDVAARLALPARPFDPRAWRGLGRGALRVLTVSAEDVPIDPGRLAMLGIGAPYRGRADLSLAVGAGASQAKVTVDLREVTGGTLVGALDVHLEGSVDASGTAATVAVRRAHPGAEPGPWPLHGHLAKLSARIPMTLDHWIAAPRTAGDAALEGTLELPETDVAAALALVGRRDVRAGTLSGAIAIAGSVRNPTGKGAIVARGVEVKPRQAGRKIPVLTELRVSGAWTGSAGTLEITGREADGATLAIAARGRPDQLAKATATVKIVKFDIAPVAVFVPGPVGAATGKVDATLAIQGLGLDGKVRGRIEIQQARVPIAPEIGTLREARAIVDITDRGLVGSVEGKIGGGTVKLGARAGADLTKIDIEGALRKVSPIGEHEPVIHADLTGVLRRERRLVRADIMIRNASIALPPQPGRALLDPDAPDDLYLTSSRQPLPSTPRIRPPRGPWLIAKLELGSTKISAEEPVEVRGWIRARELTVTVGDTIGVDGTIEVERATVDVFGRAYRVEPGPDKVRFDGTLDPSLALRLTHDFPSLTLVADITGRRTEPRLTMSSQPGGYAEPELLAFFLGARPGGDRTAVAGEALAGAGAAVASAVVASRLKKVLPKKLDLGCDVGSSAAGASCTFGYRLSEDWFVSYKRREPRRGESPDEFQTQYYFGKRLLLEAAGSGSRGGADLLWRITW